MKSMLASWRLAACACGRARHDRACRERRVSGRERRRRYKVALVTDIGGLNDKGFNTLAGIGLKKAKAKLGSNLETRVYITNTDADRTPNLQRAAQDGYQLVIANGVLFTFGPLDTVAPAFPDTKFLGTDVDLNAVEGKPANIRGVQFREQEAGCLVGNIAALEAKRLARPGHHLGRRRQQGDGDRTLLRRLPVLREAGEQERQGHHPVRQRPDLQRPGEVQGDRAQPDRARLARSSSRSPVAAASGRSTLPSRRSVWAIGVDADQGFFGPHVLTSATKDVRGRRLRRDHRVPEEPGSLEDRLQRQLHREERRRRVRQALEGAAEEGCGAVQRRPARRC